MSDKKHDKLPPKIEATLKSIHEPPPTPREAMWQQIQARRQEQKIVRGRFTPSPTQRLLLAAAAVLVLGFLLGRLWESGRNDAPRLAQQTHGEDSSRTQIAHETTGGVIPEDERDTDAADSVPSTSPEVATAAPATPLSQAQLLHAANHFSRSGVLLAQFAETVQEGDPLDPELHRWARDLLTNTRLLLGSPLAQDPQYRKLLRDLEFTLAQIVQASADEEAEERKWVAGQVSDRSLVERLRLLVPAHPGARDI